ncbi:MAG: hypothetical protein AAGJ31_04930, partial [Verrucomicrobiota bacterium]
MAIAHRFLSRTRHVWLILLGFLFATFVTHQRPLTLAQEGSTKPPTDEPRKDPLAAAPQKSSTKPKANEPVGKVIPLEAVVEYRQEGHQLDFPTITARPGDKGVVLAYTDFDGNGDHLRLLEPGEYTAPLDADHLPVRGETIHQPAIAVDGAGNTWTFWGELRGEVMVLMARQNEKDPLPIASSSASESFADATTDSEGRVWVTWQSLREGQADVFTRFVDTSGSWSPEMAVAVSAAGEWEPQIAADTNGQVWITYDSSQQNEYHVCLARVSDQGIVDSWSIAPSPAYEARSDLALTADGSGLWIAAERGRVRWGLDVRGHGNEKGINAQTRLLFGRFDFASASFTEIPLGRAGTLGNPANLPTIGVDPQTGNPWVAYRYFDRVLWRIALTRYDRVSNTWSEPRRVS